ncbi:uncharacterized protein LOC128826571 [Malaclemys terrapin pileata]|uniref:uncharacterized protein LOC128826571 n=1 Tax=Malaclemys terrapin pileata TaxID=2991368 RepID=UPI0023A9012A|nr:uncharacterized protein LOC128826571 [Malaclemys terrapin pileata]
METMVLGRMPRAGLLLLPLLLCFGPETAGSINSDALKAIVDHIHQYHPSPPIIQYAVAISLPQSMCNSNSPSELNEHLPVAELQAMKSKLETDILYEGDHIVAAKPEKSGNRYLHSEWLMLSLDQNGVSPVSRLLDKSRGQTKCQETRALDEMHGNNRYPRSFPNNPCGWNRCFVFFTYYAPCLRTCLSLKDDHRIQELMDGIFSAIDEDHRALAFQEVFDQDINRGKQFVWNSWQTLCNVPMYQCNNQGCQSCEEKDVNKNSCLTAVKNPTTKAPKTAHG